MKIYENNEYILKFLNKAQNKIADLASLLVERGGYLPDTLSLILELSDFIECLDSEYNTWTEDQIIEWIHVYNHRANLNSIPFLLMTGFEMNVIGGGSNTIGPIYVRDIVDYIPETNKLIRNTPHNVLKGLQGGELDEYYHLTLDEITKLRQLLYPFLSPSVNLLLTSTPNKEWHERGTSVNTVLLRGSYELNSGEKLLRYRYIKVGSTPEVLVASADETMEAYIYNKPITNNTTFKLEGDFMKGGTKESTKEIKFTSPIWFGVSQRGKTVNAIQLLTKIVEGPASVRNFVYTLPTNNTTVSPNNVVVPYLLVPKSRGNLSRFEVETFDTMADWKITSVQATLADGTKEDYWLCEFMNTVVGTFDFKVLWT